MKSITLREIATNKSLISRVISFISKNKELFKDLYEDLTTPPLFSHPVVDVNRRKSYSSDEFLQGTKEITLNTLSRKISEYLGISSVKITLEDMNLMYEIAEDDESKKYLRCLIDYLSRI